MIVTFLKGYFSLQVRNIHPVMVLDKFRQGDIDQLSLGFCRREFERLPDEIILKNDIGSHHTPPYTP
jgi:hypothetical protein